MNLTKKDQGFLILLDRPLEIIYKNYHKENKELSKEVEIGDYYYDNFYFSVENKNYASLLYLNKKNPKEMISVDYFWNKKREVWEFGGLMFHSNVYEFDKFYQKKPSIH